MCHSIPCTHTTMHNDLPTTNPRSKRIHTILNSSNPHHHTHHHHNTQKQENGEDNNMKFEETITTKKGKQTITNNLEQTNITQDDKVILPYCILAIEGTIATIKQGQMITTINTEDIRPSWIIQTLQEANKQTSKQNTNKTSKTTIKGKKQKQQKQEKEE